MRLHYGFCCLSYYHFSRALLPCEPRFDKTQLHILCPLGNELVVKACSQASCTRVATVTHVPDGTARCSPWRYARWSGTVAMRPAPATVHVYTVLSSTVTRHTQTKSSNCLTVLSSSQIKFKTTAFRPLSR